MARVEKSFTVGNWTVEVSLDRILRDGESINLRPQVMELLAHLAQQPGEVVSADELREALWPQRIVTDASIYTCVAELRRALDGEKGVQIALRKRDTLKDVVIRVNTLLKQFDAMREKNDPS